MHEDETVQCGADVTVLKEAEACIPVAELVCRIWISVKAFYRWKKQYAAWVGISKAGPWQLKQLQEENERLK